jgi:alpha-L-fucosidase
MLSLCRALIFATAVWPIVLAGEVAFAQTSVIEDYPFVESFAKDAWEKSSRAAAKDMAWWQDAKFGVLIQWGPVVLTGKEVSWSRGGSRGPEGGAPNGEILHETGLTPVEAYDNLYKRFDPTKFKAAEWVQTAQQAGQRYFIFQAKHHDGFCFWNTKTTPYNIMNTPIHRDLLKEIAEACRKANMPLGIYFSQRDWYHPDYFGPRHERYIAYMHEQVRELLTNYGRVRILWLDAWYPGIFKSTDWKSEELFEMARQLQPGIIINNRSGLPGDFDTPEDYVSEFQISRPWEHDFPVSAQWAWKPNDQIKSLKGSLDVIIECVVRGGNALLGVGPMPDGQLDPRQVERMKEIGEWLRKYGEAIYGTRGGPFISAEWGGATWRGNNVYVHLLGWSGVREKGGGREAWSIEKVLRLPAIAQKITDNRILTGGKAVIAQTHDGIEIQVPTPYRNPIDTIVELTLDSPVTVDVRQARKR